MSSSDIHNEKSPETPKTAGLPSSSVMSAPTETPSTVRDQQLQVQQENQQQLGHQQQEVH